MRLLDLLAGRTDFETENDIKKLITSSKKYESSHENWNYAEALLLLQTAKQQTWLVATNKRLYCILDDLRKDKPFISWSMSKDKLILDHDILIDIIKHENTKATGFVDIGENHKRWLYSKHLFPNKNINKEIQNLIKVKMIKK